MKNIIYFVLLIMLFGVSACSDNDFKPGNPVIGLDVEKADAYFGDSLNFVIKASDVDVPLSTLKAQIYYGEEKVSETVVRTKVSGQDYKGKIYVPFLPNINNGKATLKYILQNINFTTSEKEISLDLKRPDFPYLTLVTTNGDYQMQRKDLYQYEIKGELPREVKGYIKTPAFGSNTNGLTFGWKSNTIAVGSTSDITFSNLKDKEYAITFNTYSYEAAPFTKLLLNGDELEKVDNDNYKIDLVLKQGQSIAFDGVPDYEKWWIDPDYFKKLDDGTLQFLPIDGSYRVIANLKLKYFIVQALKDGALSTLQADGTGAIWIIGEGLGKPSLAAKEVGWTVENGLCMSQVTAKKYQITLVAGRTVKANAINFKFFYQRDWGGEFSGSALTSSSDLVGVGKGQDVDKHDNGNLYLREGKTLTGGHIYKFVVDVTSDINKATLTVTDEGEQPIEIKNISFGGIKMDSSDGEIYTALLSLSQNQSISVSGISNLEEWWINPDYFSLDENGNLKFIPLDGDYRVAANTTLKYFAVARMDGEKEATLANDGHGAIWLMGWGLGSPSLDNQFGWGAGTAYCMPEVAPKIYRFTAMAGPEKGSNMGQRIRYDYIDCKFFFQNGWGGEFAGDNALSLSGGAANYISNNGNINLATGVQLEEGATYVMTVDLTAGNSKGMLSFVKK